MSSHQSNSGTSENKSNFLDNFELDFYLNESVKLSSVDFIQSLLTAAILGFLINLFYLKYSNPLSNKQEFSKNFIVLSTTTCLVITIVKSSLALSLGLVGALSIVRFRAAIKEPEELIYLFLAIAAGLGTGAGQIKITAFGVISILLIIILQKSIHRRRDKEDINLDDDYLKLSINKNGAFNPGEIIQIEKIFKKKFLYIKFISINSNKFSSVRNYEIKVNNKNDIEKIIDILSKKFPDLTILVVNNQRII